MASSVLSPFGRPEEDPFLLLESSLRCIERILQGAVGRPLQRSWIEHPYGEEEIALLEEEVLPVLQECLSRVDAIDAELLEQQREREALAAQGWAGGGEGVAAAGPVELEAGAEGVGAAEGSGG